MVTSLKFLNKTGSTVILEVWKVAVTKSPLDPELGFRV